jgi:hypothetical protein
MIVSRRPITAIRAAPHIGFANFSIVLTSLGFVQPPSAVFGSGDGRVCRRSACVCFSRHILWRQYHKIADRSCVTTEAAK